MGTRPQILRSGSGEGWGASLGVPEAVGPSGFCRNPHTLVEVTSFAAINKFQPFNVAISSNVLFLLVCALWVRGSQVWAEGWGALEADGVPGMSALCGWAPCLLAHRWVKEEVRGLAPAHYKRPGLPGWIGAGCSLSCVFSCTSSQDFHSHLTRSEVVGYLGGRWDINSQSG